MSRVIEARARLPLSGNFGEIDLDCPTRPFQPESAPKVLLVQRLWAGCIQELIPDMPAMQNLALQCRRLERLLS